MTDTWCCDGTLWQRLRCQRRQAHSAATDGAGYITPGLALLPTWLGLLGQAGQVRPAGEGVRLRRRR
ncbi:hypothetical protein SipoB123_36270 [Streptomyces ipomoeae]|nr:hypothetical protein SipoB123_36270 [Streptomyces ipomoeae]